MPMPKPVPIWPLILIALVFYSLPWVVSPGAALSMGAYDLAEWASLHPVVRGSSPPLLASFLLRAPLVGLAWIAALNARRDGSRALNGILAGAITIALLPPLEFFTQYADDPNYRQQMALTLAAFTGVVVSLAVRPAFWRRAAAFIAAVGAAAAAFVGLMQAVSLVQEFRLAIFGGFGGGGFVICCLILSWLCFPARTASTNKTR